MTIHQATPEEIKQFIFAAWLAAMTSAETVIQAEINYGVTFRGKELFKVWNDLDNTFKALDRMAGLQ